MVGVPVTSTGQATLPTPTSTASFWHSEPSKVLLGHRTTKNLPTSADVVIIGSGITGAFAAHYIAEDNEGRKLNVVMLEAREACWGATGRVSSNAFQNFDQLISNIEYKICSTLDYAADATVEWRTLCTKTVRQPATYLTF